MMGYQHLDPEHYRIIVRNMRTFFHQLSEKHIGEFVAITRDDLPGECRHPVFEHAFVGAASGALIPDVHAAQFMPYSANAEALEYAQHMFKDKWWRGNHPAAAGTRSDFIYYMRGLENRVWMPTSDEGTRSRRCRITWHSLETLVWSFVTAYTGDFEDVNFGDLYLFFCRLPLLTHTRPHSTGGKASREQHSARAKGNASVRP